MIKCCLSSITFTLIISYVFCTEENEPHRVPKTIIPKRYDLYITTFLEENNFRFEGRVVIKMLVKESTDRIILNSLDLHIPTDKIILRSISPELKESQGVTIQKAYPEPKYEFLNIVTKTDLVAGQFYVIDIPFYGNLSDQLIGYYKASYIDTHANNTRKWYAATQFQATCARMVFPCFDEPNLKAIFTINLGHRDNYQATSNMPLAKTVPMQGEVEGWVWDIFCPTPPMATYLLAFMIHEFTYSATPTKHLIPLRVWSRPEFNHLTSFAIETGAKLIEYYEKYFSMQFPLPKLDFLAMPDAYYAAVENWGFNVFRESLLLCHYDFSTTTTKQEIALVISHELVLQWFGNVVSIKWWDDFWLNEGFATFLAPFAVHAIRPEWNTEIAESANMLLSVMEMDSRALSQPISIDKKPLARVDIFNEIFDVVSYKKGSLLMRMLSSALGEKIFRHGINTYITTYKHQCSDRDELWKVLTDVAHKAGVLPESINVKQFMDTWTKQPGFPVITVTRDYERNSASISQKRYIDSESSSAQRECWYVPLSYTTSKEMNFKEIVIKKWLKNNTKSITIDNIGTRDDWIIFNTDFRGLYKVKYDEKNWNNIIKTLNSEAFVNISTMTRVQLINDVMDFAWDGTIDYKIAFELINYLYNETEHNPWFAGFASLGKLNNVISRTNLYETFKSYIRRLVQRDFDRYHDFEVIPSVFDDQKTRVLILSWACRCEMTRCVDTAIKIFRKWLEASEAERWDIFVKKVVPPSSVVQPSGLKKVVPPKCDIPEDVQYLVICTGIKYGVQEDWEKVWMMYLQTNDTSAKAVVINALTCSRNEWILNNLLALLLPGKCGIPFKDRPIVFSRILSNPIGWPLAKAFIYNNVDFFKASYKLVPEKMFGHLTASLASTFISRQEMKTFKEFVVDNMDVFRSTENAIRQCQDAAYLNIEWVEKQYDNIAEILPKLLK